MVRLGLTVLLSATINSLGSTAYACQWQKAAATQKSIALIIEAYLGPHVSVAEIERQISHAKLYYQQYGIDLRVTLTSRPTVRHLLGGVYSLFFDTLGELNKNKAELGQLLCDNVMSDIQAFAKMSSGNAIPGSQHRVILLAQRNLVRKDSIAATMFRAINGLTLLPNGPSDLSCVRTADPIVLLAIPSEKPEPKIALAHELGHVFGLKHSKNSQNLMHDSPAGCTAELSAQQIQEINFPSKGG